MKWKFDVSGRFRESGGDRWSDREIETKHGDKARSDWNPQIKKKKKKDVDGLAYKVKRETEDAEFTSCTETFWA